MYQQLKALQMGISFFPDDHWYRKSWKHPVIMAAGCFFFKIIWQFHAFSTKTISQRYVWSCADVLLWPRIFHLTHPQKETVRSIMHPCSFRATCLWGIRNINLVHFEKWNWSNKSVHYPTGHAIFFKITYHSRKVFLNFGNFKLCGLQFLEVPSRILGVVNHKA